MLGLYAVAREAARASVAAALRVARGAPLAYALCQPPGHHADAADMGGYCYLNNAVLAAQTLLAEGLPRVAVLDLDYHFGNGTAYLLALEPRALYGSVHWGRDHRSSEREGAHVVLWWRAKW